MSKKIFSTFGKKSIPDSSVYFLNLKSDDKSPLLKIDGVYSPQIPIIGVGGAGVKITNEIVARMKQYNSNIIAMGVDIDDKVFEASALLEKKLILKSDTQSTSRQYLRGKAIADVNHELLQNSIEEYLSGLPFKHNTELVFVMLGGGGGTGVGVSLKIIELLKGMGKLPVPFVILPTDDENTRIKFNSAVALYHFSYAPIDRCHNLLSIILDNNAFQNNNKDQSITKNMNRINERIGAAIGDIILSTELPSSGYNTDLNEFIEIFRTIKGVGCISYLHADNLENRKKLFSEINPLSHSLECSTVTGTRSYFFMQSGINNISSLEYRTLMKGFNNIDVFPKLNESGEGEFLAIRSISTGVTLPERISRLMAEGEDVRVTLLSNEIKNSKEGKGNPKIDRLEGDSDIDVKNAEELKDVRAEEYAELRRRGDLS